MSDPVFVARYSYLLKRGLPHRNIAPPDRDLCFWDLTCWPNTFSSSYCNFKQPAEYKSCHTTCFTPWSSKFRSSYIQAIKDVREFVHAQSGCVLTFDHHNRLQRPPDRSPDVTARWRHASSQGARATLAVVRSRVRLNDANLNSITSVWMTSRPLRRRAAGEFCEIKRFVAPSWLVVITFVKPSSSSLGSTEVCVAMMVRDLLEILTHSC